MLACGPSKAFFWLSHSGQFPAEWFDQTHAKSCKKKTVFLFWLQYCKHMRLNFHHVAMPALASKAHAFRNALQAQQVQPAIHRLAERNVGVSDALASCYALLFDP